MANEKRLIDATDWDSFYADMGDSRNTMDSYDRGYTDALDRVDDWMDAQPTVDAVEVVHGRWVKMLSPWSRNLHRCSVCEAQMDFIGRLSDYKYCFNCGAKMDGGNEYANTD